MTKKTFENFNGFHVNPVVYRKDPDDLVSEVDEQCTPQDLINWEDDETINRITWSVFGHQPSGQVECICDCDDEDTARGIEELLNQQRTDGRGEA